MKNILVVGSINQDITLHMEKLPFAGETVLATDLKSSIGGKGANQAVAAARMDANVSFIGAVGKEKGADIILDTFKKEKINISGIKRLDVNTGTAYISIDKNAENNIIVFPGANFSISKQQLDENIELFKEADYCLLQLEVPMEIIEHTVKLCKQHNVKIVLNPAPYHPNLSKDIIKQVDYFVPNETEFLHTIKEDIEGVYDVEWFKKAGEKFVEEYDLTLIITLGKLGALIINEESKLIPSHKAKAKDTTAAGDSFIGGFLAALSQGKSEYEALDFGARVASITISRYGAISAIPYKNEIKY